MKGNRRMRGLFISPDLHFHGGDRSLYALLKEYFQVEQDLMIPPWRYWMDRGAAEEVLRKQGVKEIKNFFSFGLPRDYCYRGRPAGAWQAVKNVLRKIIYRVHKKKVYFCIKEGGYDFIHLNSISLHSMIRTDLPYFVHIRESWVQLSPKIIENLKKACGVIFVDRKIEEDLASAGLSNTLLLSNPYDMIKVGKVDRKSTFAKWKIEEELTILSIIGAVIPTKGVDKVIQAFMRCSNTSLCLLVVGEGYDSSYMLYCKRLAKEDSRIRFLGGMTDIESIYAITDYLVKGEDELIMSRTITEGLYSGCGVILPNKGQEVHSHQKLISFRDQLYPYQAESIDDLTRVIEEIQYKKRLERIYRSDAKEYAEAFHRFICESIGKRFVGEKN